MTQQQELSQDDQLFAEVLANRLTLLLAVAPISDQQRAQLAKDIPSMDAKQLEAVIEALENAVPDGLSETEMMKNLESDISSIKDSYDKARQDSIDAAHAELDDIESIINNAKS